MLKIHRHPKLTATQMILGFSGWMDGGDVSTGTVQYLVEKLGAEPLGEIVPDDYYIYNIPGSMEMSAFFRPRTRIEDGIIEAFEEPDNTFYYDEERNLILFEGKEPNLLWRRYAENIFSVASQFDVKSMCFCGSVTSLVPHTRPPRFHCSVSNERLREKGLLLGLNPANYQGPASIVTYLVSQCEAKGLEMATIISEVPSYVQGRNIKCIEAVIEKMSKLLEVSFDPEDLHIKSEEFEKRLNRIMEERSELKDHIERLEKVFDEEVTSVADDGIKDWFDKQGIELN